MKNEVSRTRLVRLLSVLMATVVLVGVISLNSARSVRLLPCDDTIESGQDEVVCVQIGFVVTSDVQF